MGLMLRYDQTLKLNSRRKPVKKRRFIAYRSESCIPIRSKVINCWEATKVLAASQCFRATL